MSQMQINGYDTVQDDTTGRLPLVSVDAISEDVQDRVQNVANAPLLHVVQVDENHFIEIPRDLPPIDPTPFRGPPSLGLRASLNDMMNDELKRNANLPNNTPRIIEILQSGYDISQYSLGCALECAARFPNNIDTIYALARSGYIAEESWEKALENASSQSGTEWTILALLENHPGFSQDACEHALMHAVCLPNNSFAIGALLNSGKISSTCCDKAFIRAAVIAHNVYTLFHFLYPTPYSLCPRQPVSLEAITSARQIAAILSDNYDVVNMLDDALMIRRRTQE